MVFFLISFIIMRNFLSVPSLPRAFIINECWLLSNDFPINWDNYLGFLLCSVNMGNCITIFFNAKSKLYSQVKTNLVRMYSFKYIARLDLLLFCLEFLYLCLWVMLTCYWHWFSHSVFVWYWSRLQLGDSFLSVLWTSLCNNGTLCRTNSFVEKILNDCFN